MVSFLNENSKQGIVISCKKKKISKDGQKVKLKLTFSSIRLILSISDLA